MSQQSLFGNEKKSYRVWHLTTHPYIPVYYPASNFDKAKAKIISLVLQQRQGGYRFIESDICRIGLEVKDFGVWNEWKDIDGKNICQVIGIVS